MAPILPEIKRFSNPRALSLSGVKTPKKDFTYGNEFDSALDQILLSNHIPACVVINRNMEVLQFRGEINSYIQHAAGKATLNILKMVSPEIGFELRIAITNAIKSRMAVKKLHIEIKKEVAVSLEVVPITLDTEDQLLLILFKKSDDPGSFLPGNKATRPPVKGQISRLKVELSTARSDMQAFADEQEVFNQELQNANEKIVSSNEELQSVNEELETSKEEVESTNEELITANQELQTRNDLLNESYDYSEAIISTIHEPMIVLDKDLRVKSANKSFYINFQVTEEETEKTLLYNLGNKQWNIPRLRELLEDIIVKNTRFHGFVVTHTFIGIGEKTMLLNASRIIQEKHGEQLILLAIDDITERTLLQHKETEGLRKDLVKGKSQNLVLEKAVKQRADELELVNKRLEEKNFELERMNKELESFTYLASHDLQEPLRKIQAFTNRIFEKEDQNLSENGKVYFHRMQVAAGRMQQLIEDLLVYSRTSTADRKFQKTHLSVIVNEVINELKETIRDKKATVKVSCDCEVSIIPFQFHQLVQNLVTNALKFLSEDRAPQISIVCRIIAPDKLKIEGNNNVLPNKKYCQISISDNGIGFDTQYKDRIFEVFQRLHGKEEYPGTGIGLAIVKKVIDNHNGFIDATSKLNKGTFFNVYIPVY